MYVQVEVEVSGIRYYLHCTEVFLQKDYFKLFRKTVQRFIASWSYIYISTVFKYKKSRKNVHKMQVAQFDSLLKRTQAIDQEEKAGENPGKLNFIKKVARISNFN